MKDLILADKKRKNHLRSGVFSDIAAYVCIVSDTKAATFRHYSAFFRIITAILYAYFPDNAYFAIKLDFFFKIQYTNIAVLGGELAVPCYPQSATAELNAN